ncbi:HAMP domain-containing histidine kinase [Chitinophagaceae bacterium LB-8]|uniref:histidine kinase n=1 Tax=Paraflavisolibacter caeni TaxID=2982496 RepID=A0A9X2XV48_9BACT|nr:HAMP domain-containing sensor histidine kinase [Paraflavisolibacter caeni]MCU7549121.1 HAMP domain-containing histidine kinase [Paraflavisolibacter caeni]
MPVRLRITLLFTAIVFTILGLLCSAVFYNIYTNRQHNAKARLTNRAITTGRLLSQSAIFNSELLQKIDSSTALSFKRKTVQAYDYLNNKVYSFSDHPEDTVFVSHQQLDDARVKKSVYFKINDKDAVAYHYTDKNNRIVIVASGYDDFGNRLLRQLAYFLILSFVGGNIIAFISGLVFSKKLLQPVQKIADEVNEISAQNLTRRIATTQNHDEWNHLSQTLNELLNRLQESFQMQQRFIANASHEISTPLTSISSQLEVSLQRERTAEEYRNVMNSIYQDVRHMSKLTQTLLEFAKASGSAGGIEINPLRLDEIVLRLPSEVAKLKNQYNVLLSFGDLPEDEESLIIYGNEELLFTSIKNIVINACKYSESHEAKVRLSADTSKVYINIEDTGKGIPESELNSIFEPFYRVEDSRSTEGFGLGLSLANRIIKLHKGEIAVESKPGTGTKFTISFIPGKYNNF